MEASRRMINLYGSIYDDVFCHTFNQSCYVFLCGGAQEDSIRDHLRKILQTCGFQIFYPEDLFMELLNRNKKSDLLEYETLLANNSDIICIVCESMGSAVELGAFIQNRDLQKKMVVAIDRKYSKNKSFIMMGPVKHLKKHSPIGTDSIVTYRHNEIDSLGMSLAKTFRKLYRKTLNDKHKAFDSMSAFITFLPFVVYFFQYIDRNVMYKTLKSYLEEVGALPTKYNELFKASLSYLIKNGILITGIAIGEPVGVISLSSKGYAWVLSLIYKSTAKNKTLLHDRIRCAILKEKLQLNN